MKLRLKEWRKERGIRVRDLARTIGMHHATVQHYEINRITPSLPVFVKLCRALNVDMEDMIDE